MQVEEILIIKNDDISYGIDTAAIDQILRVPDLTPLAMSPKEVRGLCAVGGDIASALDINLLLGLDKVDKAGYKSRLLTLTADYGHTALLVTEVVDTVTVDAGAIEYIDNPEDAVSAIYKYDDDIVQVLDLLRLIEGVELRKFPEPNVKEGSANSGNTEENTSTESERFLLFSMARERFAINIEILREIIAVPESFTKVAGSGEEIVGIISLRQELLLIADLRKYFEYEVNNGDKNRILVARINDKNIGLIVDDIIDIRDYPSTDVEAMPEHFKDQKISGVIHDDEKLVSLIGKDVLSTLVKANERHIVTKEEMSTDEASDIAMEVVVFRLGDEEYAINIEDVAEIIDMTPVTPVADAPELISGVINIRGQVVPIGSLHKRLGIPSIESDDQKVVICQIDKNRVGFFVDSVSDVMGIMHDEIRSDDERGELFSNILQLDEGERLVLLFDTGRIM